METKANDMINADPMRGAEQSIVNQSPYELETGLTKREHFASMAMQGLLCYNSVTNHSLLMVVAVEIEDRLIEELNRVKAK